MSIEGAAIEGAMALASPAQNFFWSMLSHAFSCKHNVEAMEEEARKLHGKLEDMRKVIKDDELNGKVATREMEIWLEDADKMCDEAKREGDKFDKMSKCLGGCTLNIVSSCKLSMRAAELKSKVGDLATKIPPVITRHLEADRFVSRPYEVLVGSNSEVEQLHQLAGDPTVNVIGVCGMGGVGKTVLLNSFHNEFHQRNPHYLMIWIDMEDHHNLEVTQKAIADGTGLPWDENERHDKRARRLSEYLSKKSFLLILDHVWKAVDLNEVGIPTAGANGSYSKVVVASRIEDECNHMGAEELVQLQCLEWEDSWRLFERARTRAINAMIRMDAEILVEKCGGLPLALVKIGHAMTGKETLHLWKHAITALENKPLEIPGMEDVLSRLKLSYDHLPDERLRTCLLYCAMFPEGHDIDKEAIVDYCIGEGVLVDLFYEGDDVYNEGYSLLDVLMSASMLLQLDCGHVNMNPIVRNLVLWIESGAKRNKCLVRSGKGLVDAPEVDEWRELERISLSYNRITKLSAKPDSPSLVTLLLYHNPLVEICDGFFHTMRNLRVLDLSHSFIENVPAEIGELVQLQYLDFCNTKIKSLPVALGSLVKLRYFLLSFTMNLTSIPPGLIQKLSELRVLYMDGSYVNLMVEVAGEGVNLGELETLKRLKALGISVATGAALGKLVSNNQLATSMRRLELKGIPDLMCTFPTSSLESKFRSLKLL